MLPTQAESMPWHAFDCAGLSEPLLLEQLSFQEGLPCRLAWEAAACGVLPCDGCSSSQDGPAISPAAQVDAHLLVTHPPTSWCFAACPAHLVLQCWHCSPLLKMLCQ